MLPITIHHNGRTTTPNSSRRSTSAKTDYLDLLELFPATLVRDAGRYTKQDIAKPSH